MPYYHLRARLNASDILLVDASGRLLPGPVAETSEPERHELRRNELARELGPCLWRSLREEFPQSLGAILMPEHLHLVTPGPGPDTLRRRLALVLRGAAKGLGRATWRPVELPMPIPDKHHLRRQVRYVALNPCRKRPRLAADPLEWRFSTHRDVMGAIIDPWVTAAALAAALGEDPAGFARRWHRYVSSDPCVDVQGTAMPVAEPRRTMPQRSLDDIRHAVAEAMRCSEADINRRGPARDLFVELARHQGVSDVRAVAAACEAVPSTVRRAAFRVAEDGALLAAALTLGDRRLLAGPSGVK